VVVVIVVVVVAEVEVEVEVAEGVGTAEEEDVVKVAATRVKAEVVVDIKVKAEVVVAMMAKVEVVVDIREADSSGESATKDGGMVVVTRVEVVAVEDRPRTRDPTSTCSFLLSRRPLLYRGPTADLAM